MSEEEPKTVNPESDIPVSEQLAERNKELGNQAVNLAEFREDMSSSLEKRFYALLWRDKKWWKKATAENADSRDRLNQEVQVYMGEIREEAENYVAAYEEYEAVLAELSRLSGAEAPQQKMVTFIEEMDGARQRFFRYEAEQSEKGDTAERNELFKKQARLLAVKDFFSPRLPLDPEEAKRGYMISTLSLDESTKYRTSWPGERLPRRDVGLDDRNEALNQAQRLNAPAILEITIDSTKPSILDGRLTEERYMPLSEKARDIVGEFPDAIEGVTNFYRNGSLALSRMPRPAFTISFKGEVRDVKRFEEKMNEPTISVVLEYEVEGMGGTEHKRVELTGSDEDIRQQALQIVINEEMGPESGMNLVHAAVVSLPDGSKQSWHEFTQPKQEEAA